MPLWCSGEFKTFTCQDHSSMKARIICVSGDSVTMEKENGRTLLKKIDAFTIRDQDVIRRWEFEGPLKQDEPFVVLNLLQGETLPYPLAIVKGRCKENVDEIRLDLNGEKMNFPVIDHRFNSIVMLKKGLNKLKYSLPESKHTFKLRYVPSRNVRKLRLVYAFSKESGGDFWNLLKNESGSKAEIKKKLELSLLMYQTSLAEIMNKSGYGRLTFEILAAKDGGLVHELEIDHPTEEFRKDVEKLMSKNLRKTYPFDEKIQDLYCSTHNVDFKTGRRIHRGVRSASRRCIYLISKSWGICPSTLEELNWALVNPEYRDGVSITDSLNSLWLREGGQAFYAQKTLKEGIMNSGNRWIFNQFLLLNAYKYRDSGNIELVNELDQQPVMQSATSFAHALNPFLNTNIRERDILARESNGDGVSLHETKDLFTITAKGGIRSIEFYEYSFSKRKRKSIVMSPYTLNFPKGGDQPKPKDKLPTKVEVLKSDVIYNLYEIPDLRNVPRIRVLEGHYGHGRHWLYREDQHHDESLLKLEDSRRFTVQGLESRGASNPEHKPKRRRLRKKMLQ